MVNPRAGNAEEEKDDVLEQRNVESTNLRHQANYTSNETVLF